MMPPTHSPGPETLGPAWTLPSRARVGIWCLIGAETAMFTIFVVAYLFYVGKSQSGPRPADVLSAPIAFTVCLLSSSLTIHAAVRALREERRTAFVAWWLVTIALGAAFMAGTLHEWQRLIVDEGLTIQRNLFGTTYYSLVGLHAVHVTVGLAALLLVWLLAMRGHVRREHAERADVLSMYWHFVDGVWVVVFLVVYVIGR